MSKYLVTRWFGTFLYDDKEIVDSRLFSKDESDLKSIINSLIRQNILDDERILSKNNDVIVSEKRLAPLGIYQPENPFFDSIDLHAMSYGFSETLLQHSLVHISEDAVDHALTLPDYQVIQMVNAVDDLLQTANLISERVVSWSIFPVVKNTIQPFEQLLVSVKTEISRLESEIEKQMVILAPNICSLIGPLLSARLVSSAGSLEKLAKLPASSIQILGAEKALFRFKKEGGRPPKHGIIFQHSLINTAPKKIRGKYARVLSSKISIASKADAFTKRDISKDLISELQKIVKEIKKSTNV